MTWKSRRRWALFVLIVGLPVYIVLAVNLIGLFDRPSFLLELAIYVGLGVLWALPLRRLFRGIGQPEPEDERDPPARGD